ncbi:hypothetical protein L0B53_11580 [Vibrio sp. SS-MA-C1-2]|uniref:hypothetical protein n=1 Tax=Vibrio sp. SS-MA-C1-2 TaxID=2908646 RepID=UPI001F4327E0|nr:hypothetical protein [Vibrio sp. SS-MA-C1-2]UJF17674.1 hypothetical protein L0B53_11580 [Vibrio sp. SS-MA-C1-2]
MLKIGVILALIIFVTIFSRYELSEKAKKRFLQGLGGIIILAIAGVMASELMR